jgi:hypothetical protein
VTSRQTISGSRHRIAAAVQLEIAITERSVFFSQRGLVVRMLLQRLYPALLQGGLVGSAIARGVSALSAYSTEYAGRVATDFRFIDRSASQSLSASERQRFIADFDDAVKSLQRWSLEQAWASGAPHVLRVCVSPQFRISRALVPAWEGHSGVIEFPVRRVVAGQAAIVHELTHVFFPNGNRFLAEGLAIYLQALLGRNPTFPNFSQPLHEAARHRLNDVVPASRAGDAAVLDAFHLASLDAIPTPNPLTLEIGGRFCGEDKDGQATLYCLAGSYVQYLIESHGFALFRRLYTRTPLRVGELDAGSADRWLEVYGRSLFDLESQWKSLLTETGMPSRISV